MAKLSGTAFVACCLATVLLTSTAHAQSKGPVIEGMIDEDAYQTLRSSGRLQKVPGGSGFVYLEVTPADASIKIGNKKYSGSPTTAEDVPTGYQRVELKADGAQALTGYVLVEPLKVAKVRVFIPPSRGDLTVLPDPPGADVYIDGKLVGQAPLTVERLDGGRHDVLLKSGNLSWSGSVSIGGGTEVLRAKLKSERVVAAPVVAPRPEPVHVVEHPAPAPVATPEPVAAVAPPTRPASPSGSPAPSGGRAVDMRSLSPTLRTMAWQNLTGKQVEVELVNGSKATVEVGGVEGSQVVLKVGGEGRLVPIEHILSVTE